MDYQTFFNTIEELKKTRQVSQLFSETYFDLFILIADFVTQDKDLTRKYQANGKKIMQTIDNYTTALEELKEVVGVAYSYLLMMHLVANMSLSYFEFLKETGAVKDAKEFKEHLKQASENTKISRLLTGN